MAKLNRRNFIGAGAALGAGLAGLGVPRPGRAQEKAITVTAFGGVWEKAVRSCFVAPFEAKTKAKANVSLGGPPQWLAQVEADPKKPPVDVLIMTPDWYANGKPWPVALTPIGRSWARASCTGARIARLEARHRLSSAGLLDVTPTAG